VLSPPLTALLLLGLLALPALLVAAYAGYKAGRRVVPDPWSCGYAYSTEMSVTASNFDQPITATFSPIYQLRSATGRPLAAMAHWARTIAAWIARAEPILERAIRGPTTRAVGFVGQRLQALQMGDLRMYCLYIILTLVILLVVTVR
jgi:hydrogenase-4 component B